MAIADGLYEIRSALLESMALDIAGGSTAKGANVQIYANNDTNAQKYRITEETTGHWSIVSVKSGMFLDVYGGSARNGANVQQWTSNGSRAQRWKLTETGETVTVDGVACPVVTIGSYVTTDGATYVMDVKGAMTTNSTNVQIWTANETDAQEFVLVPTTPYDPGMPAPAGLGWARAVGGQGQLEQPEAATLYPCWSFTDAWDATADHGFEFATRDRSTAGGDASPGAWSAWSAWQPAAVTVEDGRAWLTAGIGGAVAAADKSRDVNVRVRPTSTEGGQTTHGPAASAILTATTVPAVTVTAVALGPEAVTLTLATDYVGGTNYVTVSAMRQGGAELLAAPVEGSGYGPTLELEVPIAALAALPAVGQAVTLDLAAGTDQYAPRAPQASAGPAVTWAQGRTTAVTPDTSFDPDAVARITTGAAGTMRAWAFMGGKARALDVEAGAAVVPYPFGEPCDVYVTVEGLTAWGSASVAIAADDARKHAPCHAWTWPGGTLVIDGATGQMETSRTVKSTANVLELEARPWQTVTFAETMQGAYKAAGTLGASTVADVEALVAAHHALYRAPSGQVADVAVTDASYEVTKTLATATVTMVEETL